MDKIRVDYWIGTEQCVAYAKTVRGAFRIASRNWNAYDPRFSQGDRDLIPVYGDYGEKTLVAD